MMTFHPLLQTFQIYTKVKFLIMKIIQIPKQINVRDHMDRDQQPPQILEDVANVRDV